MGATVELNNNSNSDNNTVEMNNDLQALLRQLRVSSGWVTLLLASQCVLAFFLFGETSMLYIYIHLALVLIGLIGNVYKHRTLLFTHLVYTITLTTFLMFTTCWIILSGYYFDLWLLPLGSAFYLIQSIGVKHERALLVLLALVDEMKESSVESGLPQSDFAPVSEEAQPLIPYEVQQQQENPQLTEEQEMQQIIAMIQAREAAELASSVANPVANPVANANPDMAPTMPQYPFAFPPQMYSPYQANGPAQPMMYPYPPAGGMGQFQPYPAMMMMVPPHEIYNNPNTNTNNNKQ